MISDRAFIFHMSTCIPYGKIFFFSTKAKVICQGYCQISRSQFSKSDRGIHVSQKHLVMLWFLKQYTRRSTILYNILFLLEKNIYVANNS